MPRVPISMPGEHGGVAADHDALRPMPGEHLEKSAATPGPPARIRGEDFQALGGEVLRQVTRAAKRKREADGEYEQAVTRAGRLGLSHREIAAAQVSHGTIRAILTRGSATMDNGRPTEEQPPDSEPGELAA